MVDGSFGVAISDEILCLVSVLLLPALFLRRKGTLAHLMGKQVIATFLKSLVSSTFGEF